jgi:hypothetical protein
LAHEVFDLFRRNIVNQPFCVLKKGRGGEGTHDPVEFTPFITLRPS